MVNNGIHINIGNLLKCHGIESERVEFKSTWDPDTTGIQVIKTICALANDYHNLNGGYIVIGVSEKDGKAILPPCGLNPRKIEEAQKWIRDNCRRIRPAYFPIVAPVTYQDKHILVIWAPASDSPPHRTPKFENIGSSCHVRQGSETVDAESDELILNTLLQQSAIVPWDVRRAQQARLEDLSEPAVRRHLRILQSELMDEDDIDAVCRCMRIISKINDHCVPLNVGLLFFSLDPQKWFVCAYIEVVIFADDQDGDIQEERIFKGPLAEQLINCINYLESQISYHNQKQRNQYRSIHWTSYPIEAIRETLVNAVYHRSYDQDQQEPVKVYIHPDRMEIISFPGPHPGIRHEHLKPGSRIPPTPARNRRIGEFLKELDLAEGRLTGLVKIFRIMNQNGSPEPEFLFGEDRSCFQVVLPAHPEYAAISLLRNAAHLRSLGKHAEAFLKIRNAWETDKTSVALTCETIKLHVGDGRINLARDAYETFKSLASPNGISLARKSFIDALWSHNYFEELNEFPQQEPSSLENDDGSPE